jgi:holo-[acyl-carrier protein] synthase
MFASLVVGVDIVAVDAIRESMETFGDRFLRRIFTEAEIDYSRSREDGASLESLAARFAAKEAVIKALRASEQGIDWRSIEVVREPDGACALSLSGSALRAAEALGAGPLSVSLSHAGGFAVAFVAGPMHGSAVLQ